MTRNERTGWLGLAASLGFLAALLAFAAFDPAYSHATKAVSELGAVGAPNRLAWNLIGFLGVGGLLSVFGWGLGKAVDDRPTAWLLLLFGIAFAATAVPADMSDLGSAGSVAHIVASQAVFLFWVLALGRLLFVRTGVAGLRLATAAALVLAVASIVLRGSELLLPGLSQRVSFAVMFGWVAAVSALLLRSSRRDPLR